MNRENLRDVGLSAADPNVSYWSNADRVSDRHAEAAAVSAIASRSQHSTIKAISTGLRVFGRIAQRHRLPGRPLARPPSGPAPAGASHNRIPTTNKKPAPGKGAGKGSWRHLCGDDERNGDYAGESCQSSGAA
jgi:hypothetical protein